ncbi:hypothetical protein Tco_0828142 [Tanacetum coccineum]
MGTRSKRMHWMDAQALKNEGELSEAKGAMESYRLVIHGGSSIGETGSSGFTKRRDLKATFSSVVAVTFCKSGKGLSWTKSWRLEGRMLTMSNDKSLKTRSLPVKVFCVQSILRRRKLDVGWRAAPLPVTLFP